MRPIPFDGFPQLSPQSCEWNRDSGAATRLIYVNVLAGNRRELRRIFLGRMRPARDDEPVEVVALVHRRPALAAAVILAAGNLAGAARVAWSMLSALDSVFRCSIFA